MKHSLTDEEFDRLWQRAEAESHAAKLQQEYPVWRRNHRRNIGLAASLVAVTAVALPLLTRPLPTVANDSYTAAYCNRPETNSQYWVDMADALLMEA